MTIPNLLSMSPLNPVSARVKEYVYRFVASEASVSR